MRREHEPVAGGPLLDPPTSPAQTPNARPDSQLPITRPDAQLPITRPDAHLPNALQPDSQLPNARPGSQQPTSRPDSPQLTSPRNSRLSSRPGLPNSPVVARPLLADPRAVLLAVGCLTPLATAAAAVALLPLWRDDPTVAGPVTLLFAGLFAIGIALMGEPGQGAPGYALMACAGLLLVSWAEEWGVGPLPLISTTLGSLWLLVGGWAVYRYPDQRLCRWDRRMFQMMFFWVFVPPVLTVITSRPDWQGYPADAWWPSLFANRTAYSALNVMNHVGLLAVAVVYDARWVMRLRHTRPVERRLKTPPAVAAVAATTVAGLVPIGRLAGLPETTMNIIYAVEAAAIVAVPVAFLVAIIRRQLARTHVTELVLGIKGLPSTVAIVAALRAALEDPSLDLAYWSAERQAFVNSGGEPLTADQTGSRLQATVESSTGAPLALVLADPALVRDPDLLDAAVTVAGFSLEIARLVETVERQLLEVQAAGTRAIHAADAERRRLEQDLHDGAQQHLLALGPLIGAAEASTRDPQTAQQLADIRSQLSRALKELREFARGMHPTALSRGLAAAVQDLAVSLPIEVDVRLPDDDLPKATAHAVYLVVSEALVNAAKHSSADRVEVTGQVEGGCLALVVRDDGVGGAHRNGGLGIPGMTDRVAALGGRLDIDSVADHGTTLRLTVPCG